MKEKRWKHCKTKCFVGRNSQPQCRVTKCNKNRLVSPVYSMPLSKRIWKRARLHVVQLNIRVYALSRDNAHRMRLIMVWQETRTCAWRAVHVYVHVYVYQRDFYKAIILHYIARFPIRQYSFVSLIPEHEVIIFT